MNKTRKIFPPAHGFALRAGLRAGLDCTINPPKYRNYINYTCGATNCNIRNGAPYDFACTTANTPALLSDYGTGKMKQIIANYNGVSPDEVNLG